MSVRVLSDEAAWERRWRRGRGPLDDDFVRWAAEVVDRAGIEEPLLRWREEERRGPGGRPEHFPLRALLVAMAACVFIGDPPHLTRVCDVMFRRVSPRMRAELGIPDPPTDDDTLGWRAGYRTVRHRFHGALCGPVDPSWLPKNRRLDDATFIAVADARKAEHTEEEWERRAGRLTWVINQLIETSLRLIPDDVRDRSDGSVGVDATLIRSPARAERRSGRSRRGARAPVEVHSADPDGGLYSRPTDDRDDHGAVTGGRIAYGYEATLVVAGRNPETSRPTPNVVMAMAPLHRPGERVGQNAIAALKNLRDRGHPAHYLAADRAYSSAKPEVFQLPARALGFEPVFDYKVDQLGIKASHQGFVQVEGAWYCPAMPQVLIDATKDYRRGLIDEATYRKRLDERRQYIARQKGQPDAGGHLRLMCPAATIWPVARCDNKPDSIAARTRGRIRIPVRDALAKNPPPCCTQQSITVPPEAGAKFSQPLVYGSEEWHLVYSTLRNTNEGMHGYFKDGAHEALDDPRRRRVLGVAAQSIQVAFVLMAANVRKISGFLQEEDRIEHARIPDKRRPPRRRTRDLSTWLPGSHLEHEPADPEPPASA